MVFVSTLSSHFPLLLLSALCNEISLALIFYTKYLKLTQNKVLNRFLFRWTGKWYQQCDAPSKLILSILYSIPTKIRLESFDRSWWTLSKMAARREKWSRPKKSISQIFLFCYFDKRGRKLSQNLSDTRHWHPPSPQGWKSHKKMRQILTYT